MENFFEDIETELMRIGEKNRGNKVTEGQKEGLSDCDNSENTCYQAKVTALRGGDGSPASMRNCSVHCVTSCGNWSLVPIHEMQRKKDPNYEKLAESGIDDCCEGVCLPAALFLHAVGIVRKCEDADFHEACRQFVPHWRKRLDKRAWVIVGDLIKARLKALETQNK